MRIVNSKDPRIAMKLVPWFVPFDQSSFDIGWELHERLRLFPEDTLCAVGYTGDLIQFIFIAYLRYNDAFVWQAKATAGFKYSKLIWWMFLAWAKKKGFTKIATRAPRIKAMCRRYGFRPAGGRDRFELTKEII